MINHGISTGALFLLVGVIYERRHTREISEYGGLSKVMPVFADVFLIVALSSIGLPPLNGFVGEFLILQGAFRDSRCGRSSRRAASCSARPTCSTCTSGRCSGRWRTKKRALSDLSLREWATFVPLIGLAVWIGLYPAPFLDRLEPVGACAWRRASIRRTRATSPPHATLGDTRVACRIAGQPVPRGSPVWTRRPAASRWTTVIDASALERHHRRPVHGTRADAAGLSVSDLLVSAARDRPDTRVRCSMLVADVLAPRRRALLCAVARSWCSPRRSAAVLAYRHADVEIAAGLIAVDRFAHVLQNRVRSRGDADRADVAPLSRHRNHQPRRVPLPGALRDARHDGDGRRDGFDQRVHRPRDHGGVVLYPDRVHQAEPAIQRGRGEVLPAGCILAGDSALRDVDALRPVGHHAPARHGGDLRRPGARSPADARRRAGCRGLGFKIAAAPFHMWAPDVYEGAPTPVTAFLSVGSKAASFAMLLRIFVEGLPSLVADWSLLFEVLAIVTMTAGNIAALTQSNIKRMLAYSSIAQAGYVLIGVVAGTARGVSAAMFYLAVYALMQLGAFAVVILLRRGGHHRRRTEGPVGLVPPAALCGLRDAAVHAVAWRDAADRRVHGEVPAVCGGDRFRIHLAGGRGCSTARCRSTTTCGLSCSCT